MGNVITKLAEVIGLGALGIGTVILVLAAVLAIYVQFFMPPFDG